MFYKSQYTRRAVLLGTASLFVAVAAGEFQPQSVTAQAAKVTLSGAGATFPAPLYTRWFSEYRKKNPNVTVNYQSLGSGAGVNQFTAGTVDFGASDTGMTDAEVAKVSKGVVLLPVTAGSVVVAFNVPGVKSLKLTRQALAGIFLGSIKTWNDPAIAKANAGAKLPNLPIVVITRSDGSGTTATFTRHLSAISPEWKGGPGQGKSVKWPTGVSGKGNEGVTALIQQTKGGVGYVEYSYAATNKIPMATLQNKAGAYVAPSLSSGTATLADIKLGPNLMGFDGDPTGPKDYPIVTFTWIMAYKNYGNPAKAKAMRDMLNWAVSGGQQFASGLGYIPLPANVVTRVKTAINSIK